MSLLIVVPGFGQPELEMKTNLLKHNLDIITKNFKNTINLRLFNYMYEPFNFTSKSVNFTYPGINVIEYVEKGLLGEKIYKYVKPESVTEEYVLILLDDVKLTDEVNINTLLQYQHLYGIDIISPGVYNASHAYMEPLDKPCIRKVETLELFFYLMTRDSYVKYHSLYDNNTRWAWGIDACLVKKGLTSGIVDNMKLHHLLSKVSYGEKGLKEAQHEMKYNLTRFNAIWKIKAPLEVFQLS